ncbi:MAG: hypothetical protein H0X25_06220 [Acidobacteriales bacterium]|nr:hypothetical protein [Terriglobales bacterium]
MKNTIWTDLSAYIAGVRRREDGSFHGDDLIAEFVVPKACERSDESSSARERWRRDLPPQSVISSLTFPLEGLPESEWDQCVEALESGDDPDEIDDRIRNICCRFELRFLVPFGSESYVPTPELAKQFPLADAWEMRGDFLRLECQYESTIAFLRKWGEWDRGYVQLDEIRNLQKRIRVALTSPAESWFEDSLSVPGLSFPQKRIPHYPFFTIRTTSCKAALCITVTSDLLRGVKFGLCARPDCPQPVFARESNHDRVFCSQYCGHLESVRRNRAAKRRMKRLPKNIRPKRT